ncbi:MAG: hypothetical protein WBL21_09115 [Salinimicrobium sp.]
MKRTLAILICATVSISVFSQTRAVTETGEEVILFNDGTYVYANEEEAPMSQVKLNLKEFTKSEESTFLLKSKKVNMGFWLDPKKWSFSKPTDNPDAEYEIALKGEDLYGVIITEKIEVPLESLKIIVLENAKSLAPDIHVVQEEYRKVNGQKVLFLQLDGTAQGMKISYYGYVYSNESGTVQLITFTSQNLLNPYKEDAEKLINGLVLLD